MKRYAIILLAVTMPLLVNSQASAQQDETKKFEVGAQFSMLGIADEFDEGFGTRAEPGVGGRFTFNLTEKLSLEAETNFFPRNDRATAFRSGGRAVESFFGVKFGKRFQKFGVFAKARPGLISFSQGLTVLTPTGTTTGSFPIFNLRFERLTHFAFDLGGVVEFYPSRRIFFRLDAGDTVIRYGQTTMNDFTLSSSGSLVSTPISVPGDTRHNFQLSTGVGFRF
ncbi:MAG: hypothetical protein DMF68_16355 [Acidobacteria bacterium]|nr:MAG: hypothetical protein DMF68_16355 [Acidobacteriota bacterium]